MKGSIDKDIEDYLKHHRGERKYLDLFLRYEYEKRFKRATSSEVSRLAASKKAKASKLICEKMERMRETKKRKQMEILRGNQGRINSAPEAIPQKTEQGRQKRINAAKRL